jgi:hypothetical protein
MIPIGGNGCQVLAEPGLCRYCDDLRERVLGADIKFNGNFKDARELAPKVERYVQGHPNCTLQEIYVELQSGDIPLYIALHMLVDDFRLKGPDPYACGVYIHHESMRYRVMSLPGPPSE